MALLINHRITPKQLRFINATEDVVLFGGAAGGGKTYVQVIDALLFALKYPHSKQLILRRTYKELDTSIVRLISEIYPAGIYSYSSTVHTVKFINGSLIDMSYCATPKDVNRFQSSEYDVVRFDEATHFLQEQLVYLSSRVRGVNGYPKQVKMTTNPGNVGHAYIKSRFIDPHRPMESFRAVVGRDKGGREITESRLFIPSLLDDNHFLTAADPDYENRLALLDPTLYKALRYGDWDVFAGQYFSEFSREYHTCDPFPIPLGWKRYRTIDYGLDGLACLWCAVDYDGNVYVYRELFRENTPIYEAARLILERTDSDGGESIHLTLAPPDIWGRSQESGMVKADIFRESGLSLTRSSNDREAGWLAIKDLLRLRGEGIPKLHIFNTCVRLIHDLPSLIHDDKHPTDCSTEPHDITHVPDALRYFATWWRTAPERDKAPARAKWSDDIWDDYNRASQAERDKIIQIYGDPFCERK